jgi:hypothetical protein
MTANSKSFRIESVILAIALGTGLALLLALLVAWERRLTPIVILTVFVTSIWAAIDSIRIDLQAYKTPIALHPIILFNLMYLLWLPLFPWYLVVRTKIATGTLPRKVSPGSLRSRRRR